MAVEIELKAHVEDHENLKLRLAEKAEYSGAFEKDDTYWYKDRGSDFSVPVIRSRKEKRILPDGTEKSICLATYKVKEVKDGIETNAENEFEVIGEDEFEAFLFRAGLKKGHGKRKRGWAFSCGEICVELLEVERLGWFLELEIIKSEKDTASEFKTGEKFAYVKNQLLDFLGSLGVEREAIESRSYTQMLLEHENSNV